MLIDTQTLVENFKSIKCLIFSWQKRLTSLNLSGTYQREPSARPLAVRHLDNRLSMYNIKSKGQQLSKIVWDNLWTVTQSWKFFNLVFYWQFSNNKTVLVYSAKISDLLKRALLISALSIIIFPFQSNSIFR